MRIDRQAVSAVVELRRLRVLPVALALFALCGCTRAAVSPPLEREAPSPAVATTVDGGVVADAAPAVDSLPPDDPDDGDDDEEDPGTGHVPAAAKFEKVGTPPLALTRICDLTPLGDALYAAHANQPLGTDGATVTRYRPDAARPFGVAFDWNRPGEPTKGGGAGQGFVRVHAIGGRLFVPDADPPYGGLGLVDHGTEGYVFASDAKGSFAPARSPNFRPPGAPDLTNWNEGRAGAGVLPRAYHVIDAIRYRGALFASTGSVPPKEQAWRGPSPGALHRANADGSRWTYEIDYPFPWKNGVWRLTFMVRFKGRLYAGIQDYDGREPNDYVYFAPPASEPLAPLSHDDVHPVRITRTGAAETLRFWVDRKAHPHRLYWLAWARDGVNLRVTTDGDHWAQIALPEDAGRPTDVTRFRDSVVLLTETGLFRLSGHAIDGPAELSAEELASSVADADATRIADLEGVVGPVGKGTKQKKSPFEVSDFFCTAPLAVFRNVLYAGGQRGGTLYRLTD